MATKTVVCPECGSEVAPGRYACSECGSLLAAVSATPRPPLVEIATEPEVSLLADEPDEAAVAEPAADADTELEPEPALDAEPEPAQADEREPSAPGDPALVQDDDEPDAEVDEDRPLAAFAAALLDRAAPAPVVGPLAAAQASEPVAAEPAEARAVPTWPPADDHGTDPRPVRPTPAGAWLPPSAHLDGLAVPELDAATPGSGPRGRRGSATAVADGTPGLGRFAASLDLAEDAPRQVIGAGAGLAAVGFLLPWANVLAGAGLLGDYFTQWGLAGPGHWIVVSVLVALAAFAFVGGRFAGWPVGLAAIVVGALLVGLLWPYLFGVLGRLVGVWTVLAGAIVLTVGGVLERRVRHDPVGPAVRTSVPSP